MGLIRLIFNRVIAPNLLASAVKLSPVGAGQARD